MLRNPFWLLKVLAWGVPLVLMVEALPT